MSTGKPPPQRPGRGAGRRDSGEATPQARHHPLTPRLRAVSVALTAGHPAAAARRGARGSAMPSSSAAVLSVGTCLRATACTGGTPSGDGGNEGGPTTLRYLIEEPEDAAALQALEDHLADFTEQSGIDVDVSTLDFNTMRTVLQTQLRSD